MFTALGLALSSCSVFSPLSPSFTSSSAIAAVAPWVAERAGVVVRLELLAVPVRDHLQRLHVVRGHAAELRRARLDGAYLGLRRCEQEK